MDPTFTSARVAQDKNCSNVQNDYAVEDIRNNVLRNKKLNNPLHVNYETFINALRLKALKESVNRAEHEVVKNQEHECSEVVANGIALAVKQLAQKFKIRSMNAAATVSQLAISIQSSLTTVNKH